MRTSITIIKRIRKNRAGFSLAETLITILILLMVSAIVAAALPTASTVYKKTVDAANAQVLLSTTMTILRDELNAARDITVSSDGSTISYISGITGNKSIIECVPDEGLKITAYPDAVSTEDGSDKTRFLVSEKATTSGMILTCSFSSTSLEDGKLVVSDIEVKKADDENALAEQTIYTIRLISASTAKGNAASVENPPTP